MNEVGFRREIFDFLKTGYGVTDAAVEGGGKHSALVFTRPNGPRIKTTWPRNPVGGLDWRRTLEIKRRDLVSMLGAPAPPRSRAKMEDLVPDTVPMADQIRAMLPSLADQLAPREPQPPPSLRCRLGCYRNGRASLYIRLVVPGAHRDLLPARARGFRVDPEVWRIDPVLAPEGVAVAAYGPSDAMVQWPCDETAPFGYTPCTSWVEDGRLFVRMPSVEARAPLSRRSTRVRQVIAQHAAEALSLRPSVETPTTDDIRACLATIRHIEAGTPYRLVRDGDAWVFDPGLARIV